MAQAIRSAIRAVSDYIHTPEPTVNIRDLGQGHPCTPDWYQLEFQKYCLLFVADEMMTGHRHHMMVSNDHGFKHSTCYTSTKFIPFKKLLGKATYPVILPPNNLPNMRRIEPGILKGELYIIRPQQILELDNYKNNGTVFHRQRVYLDIPYRPVSIERRDKQNIKIIGMWEHWRTQDAWMYVADPERFYWDNYKFDPDRFAPLKMIIPADKNLEPFYHYRTKDDFGVASPAPVIQHKPVEYARDGQMDPKELKELLQFEKTQRGKRSTIILPLP